MAGKSISVALGAISSSVACFFVLRQTFWPVLQLPSASGMSGYVVYRHTSTWFGHRLVASHNGSGPVVKQCGMNTGHVAPSAEMCATACDSYGTACVAFVYHSIDMTAGSTLWGNDLRGCCILQGHPLGMLTRKRGADLFTALELYDRLSSTGQHSRVPSRILADSLPSANSTPPAPTPIPIGVTPEPQAVTKAPSTPVPLLSTSAPVPTLQQDGCILAAGGSSLVSVVSCGKHGWAGCCNSYCSPSDMSGLCQCRGYSTTGAVFDCATTVYPLGACCSTFSFYAPPSPSSPIPTPTPTPPPLPASNQTSISLTPQNSNLPPTPALNNLSSPPAPVVNIIPSPSSNNLVENSRNGGGLGTGAVVGIGAGTTAVLIGVVLAAFVVWRRKKLPPKDPPDLYSEPSVPAAAGAVAGGKLTQAPAAIPRLNAWGGVRNFSLREIKKATGGFAAGALLGEGAFGRVYRATFVGGSVMAVKELMRGRSSGVSQQDFSVELATISNVRHRNLVTLRGYCTTAKAYYLVMDYAPNGNLHAALRDGSSLLTWKQRLTIALGAARGLSYLHNDMSPSILHRDIKSSNILLTASMEPLVADFGLAKLLDDGATHHSTVVRGTYGYVAPEYALYGQVTKMSDVYSFGVVLLELATGRRAVEILSGGERCYLAEAVARLSEQPHAVIDPRLRGQFPGQIAAQFVRLAVSCTAREQNHRPPMSHVLRALEDLSERVEPDVGVFDAQATSAVWIGTGPSSQLSGGDSIPSISTDSWNMNQSSGQGSGGMDSMDYHMSAVTQGR